MIILVLDIHESVNSSEGESRTAVEITASQSVVS